MRKPASTLPALMSWLALPVLALAAPSDDFARQWPLALQAPDQGAYRATLQEDVYRQAWSPELADVVVVDAGGALVPSSLFGPDQPLAHPRREQPVPWFPLPVANVSLDTDLSTISEIGRDGSLRQLRVRAGDAPAQEYVIDLSGVPEPVVALVLDWQPGQAPFERRFGVAASDDMKDWSMIATDARLIDLSNQGQRLVERRVVFPSPARARYLRLMPRRGEAPLQLSGVSVQLPPRPADVPWQWQELSGTRVEDAGVAGFEYTLQGRFPMQLADVGLPGNSSHQWRLYSRESERLPWRPAASVWLAFNVVVDAAESRSNPQPLHRALRNRYWRLVPTTVVQAPPVLRLGYRPEVIVFIAQGQAPYALLAGSARASRETAPLPQLVDAVRQQRGPDWQPSTARLQAGQALAGEDALQPPPRERDWKGWLLWALLVGGAALVGWFAISLLKGARKPG